MSNYLLHLVHRPKPKVAIATMPMPTTMAKIAIVVLIVAITAATGNGACTYRFDVKTGDQPFAGTDGLLDFSLHQKDGVGWDRYTVNTTGQFYDRGHTDSFTVVDELCIDPCRLRIGFKQRIFGLRNWYCVGVNVSVHGAVQHPKKEFKVERWFSIALSSANINTCS